MKPQTKTFTPKVKQTFNQWAEYIHNEAKKARGFNNPLQSLTHNKAKQ